METIPKTDCEKIGFFKKTHGVFGDLVLEYVPEYEISIEEANRFFVELEGLLVPFFLKEEGFRYKTANSAILTFDGVESEKYAKRMVGSSVYLFHEEIIREENEDSNTQFLNYLLLDEQRGEIGRIEQMDDYSGNLVLTVNYHGQELLVPFNEDFVVKIDDTAKTLKLNIPDGLIED
jgi:16S rRNA processing protein RimM